LKGGGRGNGERGDANETARSISPAQRAGKHANLKCGGGPSHGGSKPGRGTTENMFERNMLLRFNVDAALEVKKCIGTPKGEEVKKERGDAGGEKGKVLEKTNGLKKRKKKRSSTLQKQLESRR